MEKRREECYRPRVRRNGTVHSTEESLESITIDSIQRQPRHETRLRTATGGIYTSLDHYQSPSSPYSSLAPYSPQYSEKTRVRAHPTRRSTPARYEFASGPTPLCPVSLPENSRWAIIDAAGHVTPLPPWCIPAPCYHCIPHKKHDDWPSKEKSLHYQGTQQTYDPSSHSSFRMKDRNGNYMRQERQPSDVPSSSLTQPKEAKEKYFARPKPLRRTSELKVSSTAVNATQTATKPFSAGKSPSKDESRKKSLYSFKEFLKWCDEVDKDDFNEMTPSSSS